MNDYLMEIMKRTSVFMILAQAVIHFRPNPSYEKYFKFLAGVMTIVILVIPLTELFHSGIGAEYQACMSRYVSRIEEAEEAKRIWEETAAAPSDAYLREIGEEVGKKVNGYLQQKGIAYRVRQAEILYDTAENYRIHMLLESADGEIHVRLPEIGKTGAENETLRSELAKLLEIEADYVEVEIVG